MWLRIWRRNVEQIWSSSLSNRHYLIVPMHPSAKYCAHPFQWVSHSKYPWQISKVVHNKHFEYKSAEINGETKKTQQSKCFGADTDLCPIWLNYRQKYQSFVLRVSFFFFLFSVFCLSLNEISTAQKWSTQ